MSKRPFDNLSNDQNNKKIKTEEVDSTDKFKQIFKQLAELNNNITLLNQEFNNSIMLLNARLDAITNEINEKFQEIIIETQRNNNGNVTYENHLWMSYIN